MINGIMAKKVGMSRIFVDKGVCVPITVLKFQDLKVLGFVGDKKVQIAFDGGETKKKSKAIKSKFDKLDIPLKSSIKEFEIFDSKLFADKYKIGDSINISDIISVGDKVDVVSKTKGKGLTS